MKKALKLRGPAKVYIDWANVYGWTKSLKKEVNPKKLFKYLESYKEIERINFYFGKDKHPKSRKFLTEMGRIGYRITTKPVKYLPFVKILTENRIIYHRKCDFDLEIAINVHKDLNKGIEGFVFFTGDGDFASLYKLLIRKRKQVIIIYAHGHLGKEIYRLQKGIYKKTIDKLGSLL